MVSSSTVTSDANSIKDLFSTYSSETQSLNGDSVWTGKSHDNAVSQFEAFISEYQGPIESQMSEFAKALDENENYEKLKKDLEQAEKDYNEAKAKASDPNVTIDLSSYTTKINKLKEDIKESKEKIKTSLSTVSSAKIDTSGVEEIEPGSFSLGDFVHFYQYNYQNDYGYGTTIANAGCGPTSMSMVLTYLLGETVDPPETASWSLNRGYHIRDNGTAWAFFPAISEAYGIECEQMGVSREGIINNLQAGKPIIMSMAPGHFTSGGHYIVLRSLTEDGKVVVADPASEKRTNQTWDLNIFLNEGKGMWAFDSDRATEVKI